MQAHGLPGEGLQHGVQRGERAVRVQGGDPVERKVRDKSLTEEIFKSKTFLQKTQNALLDFRFKHALLQNTEKARMQFVEVELNSGQRNANSASPLTALITLPAQNSPPDFLR